MAKTFSYNLSNNRITAKGGTELDPITFDDLVTADRAGILKLLDEVIDADPDTFSLDIQIRPVELRALQLSITCTARGGATADITGKDAWGNNISENGIDISSGSATTTKYFSEVDAGGITVNGLQNGDSFDIEQGQWGVIWDLGENTYHLDAELRLGDGTTPTYFKDVNKLIVFTQTLAEYCGYPSYGYAWPIYIYGHAHIQLGELINEGTKETWKGCVIQTLINVDEIYLFAGTTANTYRYLYGCTIIGPDSIYNTTLVMGRNDMRIWNCNFVNYAYPYVGGSTNLYRCTIMNSSLGFSYYYGEAPTVEDYVVYDAVVAATINAHYFDSKICRLKATSEKAVSISGYDHLKDVTLLDCEFTNWLMYMRGEEEPGKILRKYSCNIHISDKNGANLSGANIICKDKDNNEVFNANTDVNGDIEEQEVTYQEWYQLALGWHGEEDATIFSPHSFTISKTGYETLEIDDITLSEPIKWHLELQDPTVCDYPSEDDVEEGVEYDSGAKIGNFVAPAEAEVKKDIGFGALGIEFLGTLEAGALLRGVNLEAQLEKDTNLFAQLEKRTNMVGIMREIEAEGG